MCSDSPLYHAIKIQPIRKQESRCIFDYITTNLPMVSRVHLTMIVLVTVFSTEWYSYANALAWYTMSYLTCHFYFLGIHTHLKTPKY